MLLPASLKHLRMRPHTHNLPSFVDLGMFTRFTDLRALGIVPHNLEDDTDIIPGTSFFLPRTFNRLTSLSLSKWPLLLSEGCSFASCLPVLLHGCIHLRVQELKSFFLLPKIKVCFLNLLDAVQDASIPSMPITVLAVGKHRHLRRLVLCGPTEPDIDLSIHKAGLEMTCSHLGKSKTHFWIPACERYKAPSQFIEFECFLAKCYDVS